MDVAAMNGHLQAVTELVQQLGIKGCGGGVEALRLAAEHNRVDIMGVLTNAGVVDTGMALVVAAEFCFEACVKYLLEHHAPKTRRGSGYVNHRGKTGRTALFNAIAFKRPSPRLVRLLVDAGADATSPVRVMDTWGRMTNFTPLELTAGMFNDHDDDETRATDITEERRHRLDAIRRLLLRLEAVHARSWLCRAMPPLAPMLRERE